MRNRAKKTSRTPRVTPRASQISWDTPIVPLLPSILIRAKTLPLDELRESLKTWRATRIKRSGAEDRAAAILRERHIAVDDDRATRLVYVFHAVEELENNDFLNRLEAQADKLIRVCQFMGSSAGPQSPPSLFSDGEVDLMLEPITQRLAQIKSNVDIERQGRARGDRPFKAMLCKHILDEKFGQQPPWDANVVASLLIWWRMQPCADGAAVIRAIPSVAKAMKRGTPEILDVIRRWGLDRLDKPRT